MLVKEVIEKLKDLPQDKEIIITGGLGSYPIVTIRYLDWFNQVILVGGSEPLKHEDISLENFIDEELEYDES